MTHARYLDDLAIRTQVERHLQLAVQAAINIAMHIVAQGTARTPEDYGDAFLVLAEEGVLGRELAERLRGAAGLRNVLVHGYASVDDEMVWQSIGDLGDLRQFARVIIDQLSPE